MAFYLVQLESKARPVYADWEGPPFTRGALVVLQTERGSALGEVKGERAVAGKPKSASNGVCTVLRRAEKEDVRTRERQRKIEREALRFCRGQADAMALAMKVTAAVMSFDDGSLLFYYTSEKRVDFRELVRTLAKRFKIRIEMRQIGVRDETKILGGYGHCGRPLCCSAYMGRFFPITIKMAKEQGLSLNPAKISGRCGRLMCCIRHEWTPPGKACATCKNGN